MLRSPSDRIPSTDGAPSPSVLTNTSGNLSWESGGGGSVASVSNSDGSLTISPTTGAVVASLNTAHSNTFTVMQGVDDGTGNAAYLANSVAGAGGSFTGTGIGGTFSTSDNTYSVSLASNIDFAAGYFSDNFNSTAITLANASYAADAIGNINISSGDYLIGGTFIPVSHWNDDGYYNLAIQFQNAGTNIGTAGQFGTVNFTGSGVAVTSSGGTLEVDISGGGGGGAPTGASYVTLATNGSLTHERVLTAGTGISITDAGAGSTVTIASTITQYTDELAQDAVGTILADSSEIDFTYDDATPSITAALKNGIAATRLADGSVSNTEFQYLGNVTSDIQTQLDSKISIAQARTLTYYGI